LLDGCHAASESCVPKGACAMRSRGSIGSATITADDSGRSSPGRVESVITAYVPDPAQWEDDGMTRKGGAR
jgi:hypothetical protein